LARGRAKGGELGVVELMTAPVRRILIRGFEPASRLDVVETELIELFQHAQFAATLK